MTFKALWIEYLRVQSLRIEERTRERYLNAADHILPFFGDIELLNITPKFIEDYMIARKSPSVANATINRELSSLRAALSKAVLWEWIPTNPFARVKLLKEPPGRDRYLTLEEYSELLKHCPDWLNDLVVVAVGTGMRRNEITLLKWESIDFLNRTIRIDKSKNGSKRIIPMNNTVYSTIKAIPRRLGTPFVFHTKGGKPYMNVSKIFAKVIKETHIDNFRFHDLRHTCASWLVLNGVDLYTVSKILGHKSIEMTQRYAHLSDRPKAQALDKINGMLGDATQVTLFKNNI